MGDPPMDGAARPGIIDVATSAKEYAMRSTIPHHPWTGCILILMLVAATPSRGDGMFWATSHTIWRAHFDGSGG